jgi:hypothetical protein
LTSTAVVEVDVAVDVEPIVDLHVDHRSRSSTRIRRPPEGLRTRSMRESTSTSPFRSTPCDNVKVDLNVFARTFPALDRHLVQCGFGSTLERNCFSPFPITSLS